MNRRLVFALMVLGALLPTHGQPPVYATEQTSTHEAFTTLATDVPPSSEATTQDSSQVIPGYLATVFFEETAGQCWMGLRIDSQDNVYPTNSLGFYKILPDGTLVNGEQNLFASQDPFTGGMWGEIDEARAELYIAKNSQIGGEEIRHAPFISGSAFSALISGFSGAEAIALGRGPFADSLFVTEKFANRVTRITRSPLGMSVFASGSLFSSPEAITSAADGTLYVVNLGFSPPQLTRIMPDGSVSTFQLGTHIQVNRAIAVDGGGNIYWSHEYGVNKYDAAGSFIGTLPGPSDAPGYGNPMGAAFDSHGNLFVVDNGRCRKIYKYVPALEVAIDIQPGSDVNPVAWVNHVVPVAILGSAAFDAGTIDAGTVVFEGGSARVKGKSGKVGSLEDVNSDGFADMVVQVALTEMTLLTDADIEGCLFGRRVNGEYFKGCDSIRIVLPGR